MNIPWNSQETIVLFRLGFQSTYFSFNEISRGFCEIDFSREKVGICFTSAFLIGLEILKVVMMTKVIHPKFYK